MYIISSTFFWQFVPFLRLILISFLPQEINYDKQMNPTTKFILFLQLIERNLTKKSMKEEICSLALKNL